MKLLIVCYSLFLFFSCQTPNESAQIQVADESFTTTYNQKTGVCEEKSMACTRDLNEWGFASQCQCKNGLTYDQMTGLCIDPPQGCTKDLNEWRNPSQCRCSEGYEYNPKTRQCNKILGRCTKDINEWGFASRCAC